MVSMNRGVAAAGTGAMQREQEGAGQVILDRSLDMLHSI